MTKLNRSNIHYDFNFIMLNGIVKAIEKAINTKDRNAIETLEETINKYYGIIGYRDTLLEDLLLRLKKEVYCLEIIK